MVTPSGSHSDGHHGDGVLGQREDQHTNTPAEGAVAGDSAEQTTASAQTGIASRALGDVVPSLMLKQLLPPWVPGKFVEQANQYLTELIEQVNPRDPLEKMLVEQLVWVHQRVGRLSVMACKTHGNWATAEKMHVAAERAMNSYRRGMLALRQYRAQQPSNFTQVNQAEQQNIVCASNVESNK